jgi:CubicO group peptidase (beta-lactamase class C family)
VVPRSTRKRILVASALVAIAAVALTGHYGYRIALVGAGFAAKNVCSTVFVSGRSLEAAIEDLRAYRSTPLDQVSVSIDRTRRTATGSLAGIATRTAIYRDGLGCALAIDVQPEALARVAVPAPAPSASGPWPDGDAGPAPVPPPALASVLDDAFDENAAAPKRTRAVVVVHEGRLVAERYAPGIARGTRLPGWSMSKSVAAALTGVLVGEGRLAVDAPAALAAWREAADARGTITLAQLLHMSSGLAFDETYANPLSDVVMMLFGTGDTAGFAAAKPLAHPPGSQWAYASGTTNVLMRVLRERVGDERAYLALPRRALLDRIGAASAVVEADAAGTFVGSSLMYASARDWARFGLLALNDGAWNGARVLPEGWVKFMTSPAPAAPEAEYAAHWWLKLEPNRGPRARPRQLPPDAFHAAGHGGQYVTVVPSRRAVIVRLGHAVDRGAWDQDAFAARVVRTFAP